MSAGVGPDPPTAGAAWMRVAPAGEPVAEVDIPPPPPSLAGGLLPSVLQVSMHLGSGVGVVSAPPGQGQGLGKWAYSGRGGTFQGSGQLDLH